MSANHSGMKAQIEEAYAPTEDDAFVETADEVANSGHSSCFYTSQKMWEYAEHAPAQCRYGV